MNKIKMLREKRGLSTRELGKLADVSYAYISQLENDKRFNPSLKSMVRISRALNKSVTEVFF